VLIAEMCSPCQTLLGSAGSCSSSQAKSCYSITNSSSSSTSKRFQASLALPAPHSQHLQCSKTQQVLR
jgi:hypothetical protein